MHKPNTKEKQRHENGKTERTNKIVGEHGNRLACKNDLELFGVMEQLCYNDWKELRPGVGKNRHSRTICYRTAAYKLKDGEQQKQQQQQRYNNNINN